jgi:eukaryotic-like serine/threonine-protein kinase
MTDFHTDRGLPDDRWREADALFTAALELDPAERAAFVRDACGDDAELLHRVQRLLASIETVGILDEPASVLVDSLEELFTDDADPDTGSTVGPYLLERPEGRGGTGTVFLGRRIDGAFQQQVAIKILRRGLDTDDVLRRFRAERQILADLTHPNIAILLDGGATSDGRPYMVMEYVGGLPITEYCDTRRLSIRERLQLFVKVVRAVGYAHRRLVIHRDIKPSNILVTAGGEPKLLDFGIAKLLEPGDTGDLTRAGVMPMTPAYASPEQLHGGVVTTGTDVYQLGVLLYVLLTGRRPLGDHGTSRSRTLGTSEPERPSVMVSDTTRSGAAHEAERSVAAIASRRRSDPERLRRDMRGDLDTIVLACLREDPAARYASAEGLAEDIERFLTSRPIQARPSTLRYRTARFIARRPMAAIAAMAGVLAVGAYIGSISAYATRLQAQRDRASMAYEAAEGERARALATLEIALQEEERARHAQQDAEYAQRLEAAARGDAELARLAAERERMRASSERDRAELERDRAVAEERRADQTSAFLVGLFSVPGAARPDTLSARSILDIGVRRIQDELRDDARTRSALLLSIGGAYDNLGAGGVALDLLEESLQLHVDLYGAADPRSMRVLHRVATARATSRHHARARELFGRLITLRQAEVPVDSARFAGDLRGLAVLLREMGHPDSALVMLDSAMAMRNARSAPDRVALGSDLADRALMLRALDQYDSAAAHYRQALDLLDSDGSAGRDVINVLNNYAFLLRRMDDAAGAEPLYRRALELQRAATGELDPTVQRIRMNLARVLDDLARHDEAEALFRARIAAAEAAWGAESWQAGDAHGELGAHFYDLGEYAAAEAAIRESMRIYTVSLGAGHSYTGHARTWVGNTLAAQGRYADAEAELLAALAVLQQATDSGARAREARARAALAELYDAWGQPTRAAAFRNPGR